MKHKLKHIKILVIEPNIPIRLLIRNLLSDLGMRHILTELEVEQGWEVFNKEKPDIILVDWMAGGENSLGFIKKVRQDPASQNPKVPIIIMSGFTNKQRVIDARDAGVSEFLIKPFTAQTLSERLIYALDNQREFVIAPNYIGPDRRRREDEIDPSKDRRGPC